jgi:hypothetical protein
VWLTVTFAFFIAGCCGEVGQAEKIMVSTMGKTAMGILLRQALPAASFSGIKSNTSMEKEEKKPRKKRSKEE